MTKKIFFFLLWLGFISSILIPDKGFSDYENRNLQALPTFTVADFISGSYTKNFDTYVSDQFMFRNSWIRLKNLSDKDLLSKSSIQNVYLGSHQYFINRYTYTDIDSVQISKNIDYLVEFQKKYNADIILVPTASEILTDALPTGTFHINQEELLLPLIEQIPDENVVPVATVLKKHASEDIFYRTDHHWTLLGAYYVYAEYVKDSLPYQAEVVSSDFLGTIYRKINIPTPKENILSFTSDNSFEVTYDQSLTTNTLYNLSALKNKDAYPYYLDGNHAITKIVNSNTTSTEKILIIKDSFANTFATILCNNYLETHMIDLRYYNGSIRDYLESRSEERRVGKEC